MIFAIRLMGGTLVYSGIVALASLFLAPAITVPATVLFGICLAVTARFALRSVAHRRYVGSILVAAVANPRFYANDLAYAFGQAAAYAQALGNGLRDRPDRRPVIHSLPFEGFWTAGNGGIERRDSHSWRIINQRYAYDFAVVDTYGLTHRGAGDRPEDYHAFGLNILAPADGVVIEAVDGIPDHSRPGSGWIDWRVAEPRGNHVVICHQHDEYSLLAHLQEGSVLVRNGDRVGRGEPVGRCGNSGHSVQPHLHYHVQTTGHQSCALGIPVEFADVVCLSADGTRPLAPGHVRKGQTVADRTRSDVFDHLVGSSARQVRTMPEDSTRRR